VSLAVSTTENNSEPLLGIGQVLNRLNGDFPDLTPSKLRFLEDQGLIEPARTQSGYRKFSQANMERLRLILTLQRDHYLPLKVIAGFLEEIDAGGDPAIPGASSPRTASSILSPQALLTRPELLKQTGASAKLLNDAISAGLVPAADVFTQDALQTVASLVTLTSRGITPHHLRGMRALIERDVEFIERAVPSASAQGDGVKQAEALEARLDVAAHLEAIRASITRSRLHTKIATRKN
jgi:DNA-binding transcriptional MerR regulator